MDNSLPLSLLYIASAATIALRCNLPISLAQHLLHMNWMLIRCCAVILSAGGKKKLQSTPGTAVIHCIASVISNYMETAQVYQHEWIVRYYYINYFTKAKGFCNT